MRLASCLVLAAGVLAGCPKKTPPPPDDPPVPTEVRPTLARTWAEVTPELYPEFLELGQWKMVPTLGQLLSRHDVDRWTRRDTSWGPPDLPVVEFIDTDRPTTDVSAIAAWVLEPEPPEPEDALLPRREGDPAPSRAVRAVLVRDFTGSPRAPLPEDLILALGDAFPPPWTLCSPPERPEIVAAYHTDRGLKIGFSTDPSKAEEVWTVDHVEFLPPGFVAEEWWLAKGYGECVGFAAVDPQGRVRKLRRPR